MDNNIMSDMYLETGTVHTGHMKAVRKWKVDGGLETVSLRFEIMACSEDVSSV